MLTGKNVQTWSKFFVVLIGFSFINPCQTEAVEKDKPIFAPLAQQSATLLRSSIVQAAGSIFYRVGKQRPEAEFLVACYGVAFLEWTDEFLKILSKTKLPKDNHAFNNLALKIYRVRSSEREPELFSAGLPSAIREEVAARRIENNWVRSAESLQFKLDNVHIEQLEEYFNRCQEPDFQESARNRMERNHPEAFIPSNLDERDIDVIWVDTTEGGIEPRYVDAETGAPIAHVDFQRRDVNHEGAPRTEREEGPMMSF